MHILANLVLIHTVQEIKMGVFGFCLTNALLYIFRLLFWFALGSIFVRISKNNYKYWDSTMLSTVWWPAAPFDCWMGDIIRAVASWDQQETTIYPHSSTFHVILSLFRFTLTLFMFYFHFLSPRCPPSGSHLSVFPPFHTKNLYITGSNHTQHQLHKRPLKKQQFAQKP